MGVKEVSVYGIVGADPFGEEMKRMLDAAAIDASGLLVQRERWDTHVYMKPFEKEIEQHRLDFGTFNQIHPSTFMRLLEDLGSDIRDLDIVILKQQVLHGVHTREMREALGELARQHPKTMFITDSRHFPDDYGATCRKLPLREAALAAHRELQAGEYPEPGSIHHPQPDISGVP